VLNHREDLNDLALPKQKTLVVKARAQLQIMIRRTRSNAEVCEGVKETYFDEARHACQRVDALV
jgi:hypothetical protein